MNLHRKIILIAIGILHILPSLATTNWQACINVHQISMSDSARSLITAQCNAYTLGIAPKIADIVIKDIPIIESHEPLVDITIAGNPRITMLPNPAYAFASPDCNSGLPAASKIRASVFNKLQAMLEYLDILATDFGYTPGQIDIKVFEGLRDLKTQEMLFNNKAQEIRNANPQMSDDEVFNETSKWVSPIKNNTPVHSTGGAVDIRLWNNETQQCIDMGPFGVIWGKNDSAPTFSENLTLEQKNNRLYALVAATSAGLINYLYEYWHFSSGDRYASYWLESNPMQRNAHYGAVNE
jgi:D-alanyl-D-alanine dipeptidase